MMNEKRLSKAIRDVANQILEEQDPDNLPDDAANDRAELLRVLARLVEGKTMAQAFGPPGNWGYGTPIGDALYGK